VLYRRNQAVVPAVEHLERVLAPAAAAVGEP